MKSKENLKTQEIITIVGIVLFLVKIIAYYLTNSVAILTDALESTINILSAIIGLYSLKLVAIPRDKNHPYGHGKMEFISATIEGVLITLAGFFIIYEAIQTINSPSLVIRLDSGILLISITALINYFVGKYAIKKGKKNNSIQLISSGTHLISDTYSTIGIIIGLIFLYFTKWPLIDNIVAIIFAFILIYTGYKIIRRAISGIMDEVDEKLLENVILHLNQKRRENWVDIHNLRIIKYGSKLHFDCHITVPWFFNVNEAHVETASLEQTIIEKYGESIELFVHTDGCMPFSCKICIKNTCEKRLEPLINKLEWTIDNLADNEKHGFVSQ